MSLNHKPSNHLCSLFLGRSWTIVPSDLIEQLPLDFLIGFPNTTKITDIIQPSHSQSTPSPPSGWLCLKNIFWNSFLGHSNRKSGVEARTAGTGTEKHQLQHLTLRRGEVGKTCYLQFGFYAYPHL